MQTTHDVPQANTRFLVYWQQAGNQLFAFTTTISAPSPKAARTSARHRVPRNGRILGVKQWAGNGLRTLNGGKWVA